MKPTLQLVQLFRKITEWFEPPRFAKYRPAPRLGTRSVERRVLRRIHWQLVDTRN